MSFIKEVSFKPVDRIHEILTEQGFRQSANYQNYFRYSILTDPEVSIILGFKLPIYLPVQHTYPIELASFNFSFYLRPRWLDDKFVEHKFRQFVTELVDFYNFLLEEYPLNYNFQLSDFESEFLAEISQFLPEIQDFDITDIESESFINQQIRSNVRQKDARLLENMKIYSQNIEKICAGYNFEPSPAPPLELKNNIPFLQRNSFIYFSDANQTENILSEIGSLSYWNDKMIKNIWARCGFESHLEHALLNFQTHRSDFKFDNEELISTLIDYARGISTEFGSFLENESPLENTQLNPFSERKFRLERKNFDNCYGLWLPSLDRDEKYNIVVENSDFKILDSPTKNLSELFYLDRFFQGKMYFFQGNLMQAEKILHLLQADMNYEQFPNFTIQILLLLTKINERLKLHSQAIVFLKKALEISKLGQSPIVLILEIHFKLIQNYFYLNNDDEKINHEDVIQKFMEAYPAGKDKSRIQLELEFWHIQWDMAEDRLNSAENRLGKMKNPGKYGQEFEIRLNYLWAQIYLKKQDLAKMWTSYEKNFKLASRITEKNEYLAKSYWEFVNQHFLQHDYSSFLKNGYMKLLKAIEFLDFREPSQLVSMTDIYSKIIEICLQMKDNDLAMKYQQILTDFHKIIQYYILE